MKQKWHKLYGNYITYLILVGLGLYYISVIALDIWVFHAPDLSFSIPCFLMLTCPAVLTIVLAYKPQGFSRLLTRCSFDAEGIHCRSPRWGRFTLRWDEIRTYGFYGYSFSYMSMPFLYFSLDPAEYAPQNGGEPAALWIEKKADSKKSGARIAGAGSCFVCCFAGAGGLVHTALQNRNFLKQNKYNGKRRFS